jgi:hypothetical protein
MDEEIFALAKQRVAGLRLSVCLAALEDYALIYGGSRGKFIPAKFFEFYAKKTTTEETAPATKREKAIARGLSLDVERQRVEDDWSRIREDLRRLDPLRRADITNYLGAARGSSFAPALEQWTSAELLAVHDIATGRRVERTDQSGTDDPREFWGAIFRARRIGSEAAVLGTALQSVESLGRLPANPRAVSRDARAVDRDEFEIPF